MEVGTLSYLLSNKCDLRVNTYFIIWLRREIHDIDCRLAGECQFMDDSFFTGTHLLQTLSRIAFLSCPLKPHDDAWRWTSGCQWWRSWGRPPGRSKAGTWACGWCSCTRTHSVQDRKGGANSTYGQTAGRPTSRGFCSSSGSRGAPVVEQTKLVNVNHTMGI